jgi:hypothetical protein
MLFRLIEDFCILQLFITKKEYENQWISNYLHSC